MVFSSKIFLFVFLPVVLGGYYFAFRQREARNVFLLAASLLFYSWGEPIYIILLILSIIVNYFFSRGIEAVERGKKLLLALGILFNIGVLVYFKYTNFLIDNINILLGAEFASIRVSMPIGISFFTFQALSYIIDVYRQTACAQRNLLNLGLYIAFFPQLIAGPIVRYNCFAGQIEHREESLDMLQSGITRFIVGFSKKILLANNIALVAERGFSLAADGALSFAMAWLGALAYSLQIYFDFSGYSDMAIGLGRMFGFSFEENFNYPYLADSIADFWRRWHISLGRWFRDYVYFPLGGSRTRTELVLRNLLAVWLLTGIWHGASWRFIVWGLLYGVLIAIEKTFSIPKKFHTHIGKMLYRVATLLVVILGWVLFGAHDFSSAVYQIGCMFGCGIKSMWDASASFNFSENWIILSFAVLCSTPIVKTCIGRFPLSNASRSTGKAVLLLLLLLLSVSFLVMNSYNPFIYFSF